MRISRQEEVICALWAIASLIAFGNGYTFYGWVLAVKSSTDIIASIYHGYKEAKEERKNK